MNITRKTIIKQKKFTRTGLWLIALDPTNNPTTTSSSPTNTGLHTIPQHQQNNISVPTQTNTTAPAAAQEVNNMVQTLATSIKGETAKFHHQALGSPPVSTILRVLHKHPDELTTFPGMS